MFGENIDTRNKKLNNLYDKTTTFYRYDQTSAPLDEAEEIQLCSMNSYHNRQVSKNNFSYNDHTTVYNRLKENRTHKIGFEKVGYFSASQSNSRMPKNYSMANRGLMNSFDNSATKNNCLIISKKLVVENGETMLVETCRKVNKNCCSRQTKFKKTSKALNNNKSLGIDMLD